MVHVKTYPEIYASNLLKPLFKDNKFILKNPDTISKIVKTIHNTVNSIVRIDPSLAACYLETLSVLISYKGKIIKEN